MEFLTKALHHNGNDYVLTYFLTGDAGVAYLKILQITKNTGENTRENVRIQFTVIGAKINRRKLTFPNFYSLKSLRRKPQLFKHRSITYNSIKCALLKKLKAFGIRFHTSTWSYLLSNISFVFYLFISARVKFYNTQFHNKYS